MPRVAVLLTPGFADWEYAPLAGAGRGYFDLDVGFFGPDPAVSMGGLSATGLAPFEDVAAFKPDVIAVIGGTIWETDEAPDISTLLKTGPTIAGICGGTLALARAGLLDTAPHTSNAADYLTAHAPAYAGSDAYLESAIAVTAPQLITASGTAPISFAAAVFDAAGVPSDQIAQFRAMMAAEHQKDLA
ncbi:MAG: DJ-1/PfpI family protein [Pseudomonadota bacterium]